MVGCLLAWLVGWMVGWMDGWLVGWLVVGWLVVGWLVSCLLACLGTDLPNYTCFLCEIEVVDQTFYLIRPQYTDTRPISPIADPTTPITWQGSHSGTSFTSLVRLDRKKDSRLKRDSNPGLPLFRRTPLPLGERGGFVGDGWGGGELTIF